MTTVTICYQNGKPVVFEGKLSQEDKKKLENMHKGMKIEWETKEMKYGETIHRSSK